MKKSVVDYRCFRFSKINQPEFKHLKYLFGWIGYFLLYFLTERFIPYKKCYSVHSVFDDMIPFCEYFIIFYAGWYLLIIGSLLYFAYYNPENFENMMKFIIVTQVVATVIYIVFPNRQDLRPNEFPRDNIFADILGLIYKIDTSTNVCPSLHVSFSIGIASTWLKEKTASPLCKVLIVVFCLGVCASVAFVKQHSVVDILVAVPVCVLAELIAFKKYRNVRKHKKELKVNGFF